MILSHTFPWICCEIFFFMKNLSIRIALFLFFTDSLRNRSWKRAVSGSWVAYLFQAPITGPQNCTSGCCFFVLGGSPRYGTWDLRPISFKFCFQIRVWWEKRAKNDRFSRVSLRRKSQVVALLQLLKDTRAPKIVIFFLQNSISNPMVVIRSGSDEYYRRYDRFVSRKWVFNLFFLF